MMARTSALGLLASLLILGACGAGQEPTADQTSDTTVPSVTTSTEVANTSTMPLRNPNQTAHIEIAQADLARRLGVDPVEVTVVSYKDVTWPDGSLGCPEPGNSYTQALVEGYQIGLRHDDRFFDYRGADGDDPSLCASDDKDGGHGFLPPPGSGIEG